MDEMLDRMSSRELASWQAWEQANGPLNDEYTNDMLAQNNYMLQYIAHVLGAQQGGKDNQIPEPRQPMRPHEVMAKARELAKRKNGGENISSSRLNAAIQ